MIGAKTLRQGKRVSELTCAIRDPGTPRGEATCYFADRRRQKDFGQKSVTSCGAQGLATSLSLFKRADQMSKM